MGKMVWGCVGETADCFSPKIIPKNMQKLFLFGRFLHGVSKRLFLICDPQQLFSAENTILKCFQQTTIFAEKRV